MQGHSANQHSEPSSSAVCDHQSANVKLNVAVLTASSVNHDANNANRSVSQTSFLKTEVGGASSEQTGRVLTLPLIGVHLMGVAPVAL